MKKFRKALVAAAVALVAALGIALSDGDLSVAEALIALGAGLTGAAATYRVPNAEA